MTQEQAWELMRRAGALEKGHFLMKSGRHADLFLQCAHLAEHADITGELCRRGPFCCWAPREWGRPSCAAPWRSGAGTAAATW